VLAAASVAVPAAAAEPPSIRAEQARERAVLAEVDGINLNLERVVQAWDGARVELGAVQRDLRANEWRLRVARRNLAVAQRRVEQRLVVIYVEGQPSAVDVFDGARSLSDLIDRIEAAQVLSRQDAEIARQAVSFDRAVRRREAVLRGERRQRAATVSRLSGRRQLIASSLAREQSLLASIHTSIQRLEAEQAARERRLAAAARARVAYQVALARQRAAAARRSRAHAPAPAPASRSRPKPAAPAPAPAARPPAPAPTTTASSPPPAPAPPAPAARSSASGHPQAAAIAARYLGVPYRWGGASPAGFDCSGLVTYVYAQLGISLPHYTVSQWAATIPIPTSALQPGDLVFFAGLSHVGIYIGNNQIIHAPHTGTVVQVASLSGWFASSLDGARRVP
jgi:cell wall-associated NlpC family hydrolase